MESLESKLDRLTPDQRKEIEDFVDFLLYRSGNLPVAPGTAQSSRIPAEYCASSSHLYRNRFIIGKSSSEET